MIATIVLNDDGSEMTLKQAEEIVDGYRNHDPYIDFWSIDSVKIDGDVGHNLLKAILVIMESKMLKA